MKRKFIPYCLRIISLIFFACPLYSSTDNVITHLEFKQLSTLNGLPSAEVQKVFQDKDGFIWIATRYGLCLYDGYQVSLYNSNLYTPGLLTDNNILCLAEDSNHNLWIGTQEGINVLNKETGKIRKGSYPGIDNNAVSCLMVTKDNTLWVGTDVGLFRYDVKADSMILYAGKETNGLMTATPIKSLLEDSEGDIWIGTWSSGLYRYSLSENRLYAYPKMNERNSAHVIYEDSYKRIWIGAWASGLFLLKNPKDLNRISWTHFTHQPSNSSSLLDDVVYDISEDLNTHTLWVGTRSGLSIMQQEYPGNFINYKSHKSPYRIACNEINSFCRDRLGNMWIGAVGGGVFMVDTHKPKFNLYRFEGKQDDIPTNAIRSLFVDSDCAVWMGIGTYGLARHDRTTGQFFYYSRIPEFSEVESMPTVYSAIQRKQSGELWFGTYDGGIYVYKKGRKVEHYDTKNTDFIKNPCVSSLYEDSRGNCWVGTRYGVGVKRADGKGYIFGSMMVENDNLEWCYVRDITEDADGNIWLATNNWGIIRISGDIYYPDALQYANYSLKNGKLPTKTALCVFCDGKGRLWAGTEGHGLFLYDKQTDTFQEKSRRFNIPGNMVGSVKEDKHGNLWLGTNNGLVRMTVNDDIDQESSIKVYTSADGLQDNFFIPNSSFAKEGELFFGGYGGYNSFFFEDINDVSEEVPFYVTNIKFFNRSFGSLGEDVRNRISPKMPAYTEKMELPYIYNNFTIEFASLSYKAPELNKYAYKLEGFDKEWQYTDAARHFAYYNNLKSGTYTFLLRATNENGVWNGQVRKILITILPPFWATWWAYLIYILLIITGIYTAYRTVRNRMRLKNQLHLREMEQAKSEELNYAKLQFFTNITHEFLTPLTIISATIDELKTLIPHHKELYAVATGNIDRLIRLFRQILEFRKAETGNLKLRVSLGDIAVFVKNETEIFQPLVKKHKLHFSVICDPDSILGYFDTDKLDKILYNLLSNAAKYNKEGGFIQVNLSYANDNKEFVLLTVRDNGCGISPQKQKNLFKRFYEGDYRRFNTTGTGIGLSLTKDLVELHGGAIKVESEPGKGTTFYVTLPIERSFFDNAEIDDTEIPVQSATSKPETGEEEVEAGKRKPHTVLVIEDNEDLLHLMVKLLEREYHVLTAGNGKDGVTIIENEDVNLIVSDIMMPEMDGIEFCKYIKNKFEYSHIPVILLTAKNEEEDRAMAYESGADGFISKPFNLTVLHARIRNLLKSKERTARDFKNQLTFEIKELNYTSIDEEFISQAVDCVNRHLSDPNFDQPRFIEEMSTSKSTLYKKLKSLTGLNTSAFIRNIRLKTACKIMEEKQNIRISDLAYAVGFNDPKYFSLCFKKEFNMLPSEYVDRFILHKVEL
ncbi:Sensor histidine kinase TodS [termite gut metagenome]|uniref:histidine kinase n=1 Tax=termite gut metagenome TaxID=433724 RepID=A0A5J4S1U3_9ZZZZ